MAHASLTDSFLYPNVMTLTQLEDLGFDPIAQLLTYVNTEIINSASYDHNVAKPEFVLEQTGDYGASIVMKHNTKRQGADREPVTIARIERSQNSFARPHSIEWGAGIKAGGFSGSSNTSYEVLAEAIPDIYARIIDVVISQYDPPFLDKARYNLDPMFDEAGEQIDGLIKFNAHVAKKMGIDVEFARFDTHVLAGGQRSIDVFVRSSRNNTSFEDQLTSPNSFAMARFQVGKALGDNDGAVGILARDHRSVVPCHQAVQALRRSMDNLLGSLPRAAAGLASNP